MKLAHPFIANWTDSEDWLSEEEPRLKSLPDIGGYSTVFVKGATPSLILKEASSSPKILELNVPGIHDLATFHTARCERGFAYINQSVSGHNCHVFAQLTIPMFRGSFLRPNCLRRQSMVRWDGRLENSNSSRTSLDFAFTKQKGFTLLGRASPLNSSCLMLMRTRSSAKKV